MSRTLHVGEMCTKRGYTSEMCVYVRVCVRCYIVSVFASPSLHVVKIQKNMMIRLKGTHVPPA